MPKFRKQGRNRTLANPELMALFDLKLSFAIDQLSGSNADY